MNTYKAKSSANRAAKKVTGAIVKQLDSGEWAMFADQNDLENYEVFGYCECPNCGINLDNGVFKLPLISSQLTLP